MEVLGYAEAARWVYGQAIDPGSWTTGELLNMTELRNIHRIVMAKAWEVAPHPGAKEKETPGSFRQHDIHPFPGGMQPPSWPEGTRPGEGLGQRGRSAWHGNHERSGRAPRRAR